MRRLKIITLAALLSGAAFGQSKDSNPTFEAADVHPAVHNSINFGIGPFVSPGRFELRGANMAELIANAYGVETEKVYGGPSWVELDKFDILAKPPADSTKESRKLMLQALLADRFKLVVHNDNKATPAFLLTAVKPKMKESTTPGEPGCGPPPQPPTVEPGAIRQIIVLCHNMTMAAFAEQVHQMAGGYLTNIVVDKTGLAGSYDFELKWTGKGALAAAGADGISIFDAVDKELGLKLELQNAPTPVIMIDSVNRKPTDNPPDVAKYFPPRPTEFDVAEIKPSAPAAEGGRGGGRGPEIKNGQLYLPGITLENLIAIAWGLTSPDMLVGSPKWLGSDRFDVIAKTPSGVVIGTLTAGSQGGPLDIVPLQPMIRALLVDRFKLKYHMEDRPMPSYTLTASKPKLDKADPTGRTKWHEGAAPTNTKNVYPALGRLVTCQNMTMGQFAQLLQDIAPGYIHNDVVDATGLEGAWDFTFSFSPAGLVQGGGGRGDVPQPTNGAGPVAADPSGGLSLFDALTKQLGLKLEMQKRPMPILVIDSVQQKPTDN